MRVDVQLSSATNDWPRLRAAVLDAERRGFDTTWVFDHFDGATLGGDLPVLECVALAGALAASTSRIGIGTLVANVANRHPALLAEAARSLQRISGGRFHLGIGAGSAPGSRWAREHDRRGIELRADLADRHRAVADQLDALRVACPDVPVTVGVNTVALATLAGRLAGGVNVRLGHPRAAEMLAAATDAADRARRRLDRPFETSAYLVVDRLADVVPDVPAASRGDVAALGVDRLVLTWLGRLPDLGHPSAADRE